jgi:hypothetical protein
MTFRFHAAIATIALLTSLVACEKKSPEETNGAVQWAGAINVPTGSVIVARTSCPDGFANASVCCSAGDASSGRAPACESWPNAPFHPCPEDSLSYPDATSCCALDDPSHCVAIPVITLDAGSGLTSPSSCSNRCSPGFYGSSNTACCQALPDGGGVCTDFASPGLQLECEFVCPTGWATPNDLSGDEDDERCCNSTDPNLVTECFAAVL